MNVNNIESVIGWEICECLIFDNFKLEIFAEEEDCNGG